MKLLTLLASLIIFLSTCKNREQKLPILNLPNGGILKIIDSLDLNLDSLTIPRAENIYLIDSVLHIFNRDDNLISKINIHTNSITNISLKYERLGKIQKFSAIWIKDEAIIAIQTKSKSGFYFNKNGELIDSFQLANTKDNNFGKIVTDNPLVSTTQPMLVRDDIVHSLGYALMEGNNYKNDNRFVLCASNRKEKKFYVNYPKAYNGKNWGGTYLRMAYATDIGDSLMVISFPATSELALFNVITKTTQYITCFPSIDTVISAVGSIDELNKKQIDIARHFFQQYSFQAIIFDKYRNVFYRILNKPISIKNKMENSIGNFEQQILVYNSTFKYLGYTQIEGRLYSNTTYLVHPKGLLIQKLKNRNDEEHIYFDLFAFDSSTILRMQTKR
jgi:hypothetical protein